MYQFCSCITSLTPGLPIHWQHFRVELLSGTNMRRCLQFLPVFVLGSWKCICFRTWLMMNLTSAGDLTLQEHSGQTGTLLYVRSTTLLYSNLQSDSRAMGQNTNWGIYLIVRLTANKLQCKRGRWVSSSKSGCCGFSNVSSTSSLLAAFHEVWFPGSVCGPQPLILGIWATTRDQHGSPGCNKPCLSCSSHGIAQPGLSFVHWAGISVGRKPWGGADKPKISEQSSDCLCSDGALDLQFDFSQPS